MKQRVEKGIWLSSCPVWQLQQMVAKWCSQHHCEGSNNELPPARGPILPTGRERPGGEGHWPRGCCGCPPGRNGTFSLLLPSPGSASSWTPEPCLCRRCLAQLHHGGGSFSLCSKAEGTESQRPLSSGSCWGTAAIPAWLETRTAQRTCWKPPVRCPSAVSSAPLLERLRRGPEAPWLPQVWRGPDAPWLAWLRRGPEAPWLAQLRWGLEAPWLAQVRRGPEAPWWCQAVRGGKANCCCEFVEKTPLRVAAILQFLIDLFRRSIAAGGNYSLGGRLCSFQ